MIQKFCGYTGLINFIFCLFFTFFIYVKNPKSNIHRSFAFWQLNVAFWSLGYFIWLFTSEYQVALFWTRFLMAGAILIPAAFLHFTFTYLNLYSSFKSRLIVTSAYVFSSVYLILDFTPLFIARVEPRFWFRWWPAPGVLYHFFQIYFISAVIYAHYLFFSTAFHAKGLEKKQLMLVAIGTAIAFTGGSTNFFIWYNIPIPPVLNFLVVGYVALIAYAVLNYKLWQIEVVVRKTVVFSGLMLFGFSIFSLLTVLAKNVLSIFVQIDNAFVNIVSIALIILLYDRIRNLLIDVTDSYLFQKKFDYRQLLKDASRGIALIQSLDHLAKLIATFITMRARIKNVVVFIRSTETGDFVFKTGRGLTCPEALKTISISNVLIKKLGERKQPLRRSEFSSTNGITDHESSFIHNLLSELKAEVVIPSFLGREAEGVSVKERMSLRSLLFLGGKKSDEDYTQDDLDVFSTLAQESAIAIENARLYDEAVKRTQELQFINAELNTASTRLMHALDESERAKKELEENKALLVEMKRRENLERLAAAIGHELNNPLGVFALKRTEFKYTVNNLEKEITELSTLIPQDRFTRLNAILLQEKTLLDKFSYLYERMKAVASTVNSLIKAEDEVSSVSLRMVLDYSFEEVRFVTYTENLTGTEVELDVSPHLPPIRGNAYQLQAVFVNLIVNAYHAMVGIPNRKISISAKPAPDQKMVQVVFSDNGKGMPKDVLERCFEYRFTTKGELGTGIGLTVCKQTIERHGGSIVVESEPDHGTKFTILIPTWQPGDEHKYYKSAFDRLKEKQKKETATVPLYNLEQQADREKRKKQAS